MNEEIKPPFAFRDTAGREWTYHLTFRVCRQMEAATGLGVLSLLSGSQDLLQALSSSRAAEVCFAALSTDATRLGVTLEQFEAALDGDAFSAAVDQLTRAICFFLRGQAPGLGLAYIAERAVMATKLEALKRKLAESAATIEGIAEILADGAPSGDSPESPVSTSSSSNGGNSP